MKNRNYRLLILTIGLWLGTTLTAAPVASSETAGHRSIISVEAVSTQVPVGCVPRLPYQVWVKYSDGYAEYRQVKWQNSSLASEQAEANPSQNPVGTEYQVKGYIIGDNTTPNGYPLTAQVTVVSKAWEVPSATPIAEPLPLDKVSIDGDNRLTWNRDLDIDHLLTLDVHQQLYNYYDTYGLPTDGCPMADGWDSPTTKLKGHGSGHYMSAMAMAFASCKDKQKRDLLRQNITLMVNELRRCQELTFVWDEQLGRYREARDFAPEAELKEMKGTWADFDRYKGGARDVDNIVGGYQECRKYGYGYLNAIPAQHCALIEKYSPYNNESGVWAPYYSVHKQLAGLIDIATYIDDKQVAQKALQTATDMGLWVWNRLHYRTYVKSNGSQEERRRQPGNRYEMWNMYIAGEVGGMAESLARLSEMTTDSETKARLLEATTYFDSPAFFDPLAKNIDAIRTRHANQHIPMVTGALRAYRGNGNASYYNLAQNFWTMIQGRYRYAMGGVGNGEMFRQPYSQMTSMCNNVSSRGGRELYPEPTINETCCAYNLAKLTKDLNCFRPDDAAYMDYYERVLYNQLVGSVNPHKYQTVYQYAVGLNASKPWGNETPQSSCCGGTGAENHVKYQEAVYYVNNPSSWKGKGEATLWVALYMPTTAQWEQQGITIIQECQWPAEKSVIRVSPLTTHHSPFTPKFTMKLRVPYWATDGFDVKLNGRSIAQSYQPSSYVEIPARRWKKDDVVEVTMPFTKHLDFGPDKTSPLWTGVLMYGPLVMATTGINSWDEATVHVASNLSNITLNGAQEGTGADAHLYTMTFAGHTFIPDYQADRNVTHYLRIDQSKPLTTHLSPLTTDLDKSTLHELMLVAESRSDEQQAWNQMQVKVPEYAPWAPHAFARMMMLYEESRQLLLATDDKYSQEEIDKAASALSGIINSMRPGNLPELEDLSELTDLLEIVKQQPEGNEQQDRAIGYANMVIRYVSDGSGTKDMIERATRQLKAYIKQ